MNWFFNIKVKTKIILSSVSVVIITIIIGTVSYFSLSKLDQNALEMCNRLTKNVEASQANEAKLIMVENREFANRVENIVIILTAIMSISAIGLGYIIAKRLSHSIEQLSDAAKRVANGELNVHTEILSKDDIGELTESFNKMSQNISQLVEDLDSMPTPVMMVDTEFSITYMNKMAATIVGKDQKSLLGQKCYNQFKTDHCQTENCALHKAMQLRSQQMAETIARPNGEDIPIMYVAKPRIDKSGKVVGALELVTDITKVKEHEKYLDLHARKLLTEMEKFADGDLTVQVVSENKEDIIGKLFNGFNKVVDNIKQIMISVTEAVQATASASNEISSSSEEMAAGAQEQSSQTTEVASAVEQMTKTIFETTKNSGNAAEAAKNSGAIAIEGGKVVEETIVGMNRVAEVVKMSAETVQALGKSSDQIGEIVQVIDDIADQTNLLALNAAIEAARAGEQGRGFAVVADEVRKLAERTTKATKEIATMIRQIQKDTEGAVQSMSRGTEEVEKGKVLADKAGQSLKQIISGAQDVVDMSTQVAAASEEQSSAAEQISKNIEAISNVTQESAAGVQQIARAAEDLNRLTVNLQELVLRFKIDDSTNGNGKSSHKTDTRSQLAVRSNGRLIHH